MKRYTPKILIKYLVKEFCFSLIIFFTIFSSLIIFSVFIEEIIFLKQKEIIGNFFLNVLIISLVKSPTIIFNFSPFIFLFSGIFLFVKLTKNNEVTPISLSGFSLNFIATVPAIFSVILGLFIVIIISPITSELSRYYETIKQKYTDNDNLLIMSETGIWIKESRDEKLYIIRADRSSKENFAELNNISIYLFQNDKFKERIIGKSAIINEKRWKIKNVIKISENQSKQIKNFKFESNVDINKLKNYFNNSNIYSIWNIIKELKEIRKRGYFGQELVIKFNKYLSLPFLLFSMIMLSSIFTLRSKKNFNNFFYAFLGIFLGIIIYFLSDLSIALGKSNKIPLILSVWVPTILIMIFCSYSLISSNE